jgi:hypothetical protein
MLAMFMPFEFYLGDELCERKCPNVAILGDSNVGKSTAAKRAIEFWGGGRFLDMGSHPTFAGLVGGSQTSSNGKQIFSWGALPSCNRAFVALDEFNKMYPQDIGSLTAILSSGIAQRVTSGVQQSTSCFVRFLSMSNPRNSNKRLSKLNIAKAFEDLYHTPQDLGRCDFAHAEPLDEDRDYTKKRKPARSVQLYTKQIARFHLSWAWNMSKEKIHIPEDSVLEHARNLIDKCGNRSALTLSPQLKWKLARVAAGVALICYSNFNDPARVQHVKVTEHHVKFAHDWILLKFNQLRVKS